ncbi:553_t:CDS:2, partial [Entrophospora sp. SA101]
ISQKFHIKLEDINNAIDQKSNIIEDGINFVKNLIKEIEIDASQPLDDNTGSNILSPSYNPISNGSISLTSTLTPTPITTTITTVTNDVDTNNIIGFLLVAICWGFTNPFIKKGSKGIENIKHDNWLKQTVFEIIFLFTRWQYILPLLLNLSGSIVYYYTLGQSDLSLAIPITNSLTFIFTTLAASLIGEEIGSKETWIGMGLVVIGVGLCVDSKVQ